MNPEATPPAVSNAHALNFHKFITFFVILGMIGADLQKTFTLRLKPGLISNGMFAYTRNPKLPWRDHDLRDVCDHRGQRRRLDLDRIAGQFVWECRHLAARQAAVRLSWKPGDSERVM
jgi:hypothetical protein